VWEAGVRSEITDIYADELDSVEICGPNVRLIYVTYFNGEKQIVARIIRPMVALQHLAVSDSRFAKLVLQARTNHVAAPDLH